MNDYITEYEALDPVTRERYDLATYIYEGHKDAYGVKGRHYNLWTGEGFNVNPEWTTEELRAECDRIEAAVVESINEDRARKQRAIDAFERTIEIALEAGAPNRDTAYRWAKEAAWGDADEIDRMYGNEYLEYSNGLPYGYFDKVEAAAA